MFFPRCRPLRRALLALALLMTAAPRVLAVEPDIPAERSPLPAPLAPAEEAIGEMFAILGEEDAQLYGEIFRLQDEGKWKAADKRIAALSDRLLMGHVLYQRYMHPRAYRSTYLELKGWMTHYADHPNADSVYRLAAKRRPSNYKWPRKPQRPVVNVSWGEETPVLDSRAGRTSAQRYTNRDMRYAQRRIRRWLRLGAPTRADNYLSQKSIARHFDARGYDEMLTAIAAAFYQVEKDEQALELAGKAAARSGEHLPDAYWWAGLSAWRMGRIETAAEHFSALALSGTDDDWLASAGAYWAARAYLVSRRPDKVVPMLRLAEGQALRSRAQRHPRPEIHGPPAGDAGDRRQFVQGGRGL